MTALWLMVAFSIGAATGFSVFAVLSMSREMNPRSGCHVE
jgi:hypothetical protein